MEQMKTRIDLSPISDEAIEDLSLGMENLWMVKSMDNVYGPFDTASLREYASTHQYLFEEADAQNFQTQEWKPFFHHVQFQRRMPKLVPAQSLISNDNFLILQNGKKEGPYTLQELKSKVNAGQVSVRSEVSVDNGQSWIKLYEHHEFDRRSRSKQGELPFTPKEENFLSSEGFALKRIQEKQQKRDEEDALIGLAFVSTGNDRGQKVKSLERKKEIKQVVNPQTVKRESTAHSTNFKSSTFKARLAASLTVFILGGVYFFMDEQPEIASTTQTQKSKRVTRTEVIDNSERSINPKAQTRTTTQRKPASIKRLKPATNERPTMNHKKPRWRPTEKLHIDDPRIRAEIERERSRELASEEGYYDREDPRDDYGDPRYDQGEVGNAVGGEEFAPEGKPFNPDDYHDEQQVLDYEDRVYDNGYEQVQDFE